MRAVPPSRRTDWETYKRLIVFSRPYLWRLVFGTLCGVLFAGSQLGILPVMQEALGRFFDREQPLNLGLAALLGGALLLLIVVRGVGQYFNAYLIEWVGNRVVMDMRIATFAH